MARIFNPNMKNSRSAAPLKVAYLIQYFQPGGLERVVLALAQGLQKHGARPVVAAYYENGDYRKAFDEQGIQTIYFDEGGGIRWSFPVKLAAWLKKEGIQLLHTHHVGPYLYGCAAARLSGIPLVHTEHSRELYDTTRRKWLGRSMDYFSSVIAVTPEISKWRKKHFGHSTRVILNGVPLPTLSPQAKARARKSLSLDPDAFVIGCVARLSEEKDHVTLLSAFSLIHQRVAHARLVIIGDGPERKALEERIHHYGLGSKVHMLGHRDDVEQLVPAFDVATLSSKREGLPLALLEAMACGVPVVATQVGGIPALLEHGGGLLVQPGQPADLAQALVALSSDQAKLQQHAGLARRCVEERHSLDIMVKEHLTLYRDLVQG